MQYGALTREVVASQAHIPEILSFREFDSVFHRWPGIPDGLQMLNKIQESGFRLRSKVTIAFFNDSGHAQVTTHPLNMRHQTVAINRYLASILKYGNCQACRGGAASILSQDGRSWQLVAYGSLCRAIMMAKERHGNDQNIIATLAAGLIVDEYHAKTPRDIIVYLRDTYNKFGGGTGKTVRDVFEELPDMEASWLTYADREGISLSSSARSGGKSSPAAKCYEYIEKNYPSVFKDQDQWENTKSAVRFLIARGWHKDFIWLLGDRCDFTDKTLDNASLLDLVYRATVVFKKFCGFIPPQDMKAIFSS